MESYLVNLFTKSSIGNFINIAKRNPFHDGR